MQYDNYELKRKRRIVSNFDIVPQSRSAAQRRGHVYLYPSFAFANVVPEILSFCSSALDTIKDCASIVEPT